jgi:hypothetical protein
VYSPSALPPRGTLAHKNSNFEFKVRFSKREPLFRFTLAGLCSGARPAFGVASRRVASRRPAKTPRRAAQEHPKQKEETR